VGQAQVQSWKKSRRVVAKVEWHPNELYPRVGFIVTNLARPPERFVAFYNHRGTPEQWINEGKGAIKWTRLSCRTFAANAFAPILISFSRRLVSDRQPWPLRHLPDGLGRRATTDVPGNPVADRQLRAPPAPA
jgi:hypothetical protein